jgi:hypothetical protein
VGGASVLAGASTVAGVSGVVSLKGFLRVVVADRCCGRTSPQIVAGPALQREHGMR